MIKVFGFLGLLVFIVFLCKEESEKRQISFWYAFFLCIILTPFIGYFVIKRRPRRFNKACKFCGSIEWRGKYCASCGRDEDGELRQWVD